LCLLTLLGAVAALPGKGKDVLAMISGPSLIDGRVCDAAVISHIRDVAYTEAGHRAGCDLMMDMLAANIRPLLKDACVCSTYLDVALGNIYDSEMYDCVLRQGVWNVNLVSRICRELADNAIDMSNSTVTVSGNYSCVMGANCIHGKCEKGACVCDTGFGTYKLGPNHPLWVGERCDQPWCPNECSGQGSCDTATGRCDCDSRFEGADCSTPHYETRLASGIPVGGAQEVSPSLLKGLIRGLSKSDLAHGQPQAESSVFSPSPTPTKSLEFIFPSPTSSPSNDLCGDIQCGPNGYCDKSTSPVSCKCLGRYTGANCRILSE